MISHKTSKSLRHGVVVTLVGISAAFVGSCETENPPDKPSILDLGHIAGCGEGLDCAPPGALCCFGSSIFRCESGKYTHYAACPDSFGPCAGELGACHCEPDATACKDTTTMLVCERTKGEPIIAEAVCEKECIASAGLCSDACIDKCDKGELRCSDDIQTVTLCRRVPPFYCLERVDEFYCADNEMICDDNVVNPENGFKYCVNECGGRAMPLLHRVCDLVIPTEAQPEPDCGFWICDGKGGLVADRLDCRIGGQPCTLNKECKSCACNTVTGRCEGGGLDDPPTRCPDVAPICTVP